MDQLLDGVDGTKDKADNAEEDDQGTPGELVDGFVAEASEAQVEDDGEDEDQGAVGESANEAHEGVKVGHGAGDDTDDDDDEHAQAGANKELADLAEAFDGDVEHVFNVERERCDEDGGGHEDVNGHEDDGDDLGHTVRDAVVHWADDGVAVDGVAGHRGEEVHDGAGAEAGGGHERPLLGFLHRRLDVRVHDVTAEAERDRRERDRELVPDHGIVVDVGEVLLVDAGDHEDDEDGDKGGEGAKGAHPGDLLHVLDEDERDGDDRARDNGPGHNADLAHSAFAELVEVRARQDHVEYRCTEQNPGVEEEGEPATNRAERSRRNVLVCRQALFTVRIQASDQCDARVLFRSKTKNENFFSWEEGYIFRLFIQFTVDIAQARNRITMPIQPPKAKA